MRSTCPAILFTATGITPSRQQRTILAKRPIDLVIYGHDLSANWPTRRWQRTNETYGFRISIRPTLGPATGGEVSYWEWFKLIGLSFSISTMMTTTALA